MNRKEKTVNSEKTTIALLPNELKNTINFSCNNEAIVTIKPDGEIEINPKYTITEAAKAFWDVVIQTNPLIIGKR